MSIIKGEDLFDFEGYERQLAKLEARKDAFGKSIIQINDRIQASYDENIAKLKELQGALNSVNPKNVGSSGSIGGITKDIDKTISSIERYKSSLDLVKDTSRLNEKSIEELKAGLGALKKQYDSLDPTAKDFKANQKAISDQVKSVSQVIKVQSDTLRLATQTVGEANNSYKQLSRVTADLKNQLRNIPGAFDLTTGAINKNNIAAVQLQRQIEINDKALKRADASMGNYQRNVGNYSGAVSGLTGTLASVATGVLGFSTVLEAFSQTVKVIDSMGRLKLGLDAVSDSSRQVSERWQFVSDLADRTGQDFTKLTENYISFAAAAKNTTLEGERGDKVFKAFSGSFAALGKSSEVANRGLYAVQQMISKGKVSSEELNQQLAEALPGANKLFADALGVSTSALAKMLKEGKVLAEDVLPKVAAKLEETYGAKASANVNTISGSFTRLTTQVKLFLGELDSNGTISKFFSSINNGLADLLSGSKSTSREMADLNAEIERVATMESKIPKLTSRYDELKGKTSLNKAEQKELFNVIQEIDRLVPGAATGIDKYGNAIDISKSKVSSLISQQRILLDLMKETARTGLVNDANSKQSRINDITSTLQRGTSKTTVNLGMGQYQTQELPLSSVEVIKLRSELAKLQPELEKTQTNIFKIGGKEAWLEDIASLRELEKNARRLKKEYADVMKTQDDWTNSKKSDRLAEIRDESIANQKLLDGKKALVQNLARIYKSTKTSTGNPADVTKNNAPFKPEPEDEKASKRVLTQYEKVIKQAEKLRGVLVDDLLGDAKAGRPLEVSDEALEKWNKLYGLIRDVANATGDQIPSNLRELNDKLNKTPENIASSVVLEDISTPKVKDPKQDQPQDLTKYNELLGVHEKEIENLSEKLATGSLRKFSEKAGADMLSQLKKIQDLENEAALAQNDNERQAVNERIALAKQEYDEKVRLAREEVSAKKELQKQLGELALASVDAIFQIGADQRSADMEANQAQMENELSLVEGNEAAQKRIKEEYAKKDLALRQKQAKMDKAQAAFSIGISTARAVVNALATGGPPWIGIALAAIVGAMGAIQLATVLAKPLPQFWKGTSDAPEGFAHVAERGPEIRESKGKHVLYDKPQVAYLSKGDKIYTASQTKEILAQSEKSQEVNNIIGRSKIGRSTREGIQSAQITIMNTKSHQQIDYDRMTQSFMKAFDSRPSHHTIIDEDGVRRRETKRTSRIDYLNKRNSL